MERRPEAAWLPAGERRQKEALGEEWEPVSVQSRQPSTVAAPVSLNFPAGQSTSAVPFQYCPGGVETQEEEPGLLWPPSHGVQESVAPVETVFDSQTSNPVLSPFAFVPAADVLQKALPAPAYLPTWHKNVVKIKFWLFAAPSLTSLTCEQLVHSPLPPRLNLPGTQSSQVLEAPSAFLPAPQYSHTLCASAPFTNPKLWSQSTQTDAAIALYFPTPQFVQLNAIALLYVPAEHSVHALSPVVEYRPASQLEQTPAPAPLTFPPSHSEHVAAAEPLIFPAEQGVQAELALLLLLPGWHSAHSVFPMVSLNVPPAHSTQGFSAPTNEIN